MRSKWFWTILIVLGIAVAATSNVPQEALLWLQKQPATNRLLSRIFEHQLLPGPLRGSLDALGGQLTRDGVITYTNEHRAVAGLAPLHMNEKLNRAAKKKLDDMFANQYFEHESPEGKGPADVVREAGYEYIVVGENLALGNFRDDPTLVQAWMDSPGHRENILHLRFQEIGVAVGQGTFEGKTVWLAVQEFGTPLSTCPNPEVTLKAEIENNRVQIDIWQKDLAQRKAKLESTRYSSQEQYEADRAAYNQLVNKTNDLLNYTKDLVDRYNRQVNDFNACLEKNG